MTSFRDLRTPKDAIAWTANLMTKYPERAEVMAHIVSQIRALPFAAPHIVELCPGAGALGEVLLTELPDITYTGIDSSTVLLTAARDHLASFAARTTLLERDLNADGWLTELAIPIHAIVSLQSVHDLGAETEVNRIYGVSKDVLAPGGFLLNADFVVPPGQESATEPGRRSIPRHLELLRSHGYEPVACSLEAGGFGCCIGFVPV